MDSLSRISTAPSAAKPPSALATRGSALLQRKCACGGAPGLDGECAECRKRRLARQRDAIPAAEPSAIPPLVHEALRAPGQPLEPTTRAFMESRFRHDFSRVRVHTDARAAESARAVSALAYTVGHDIVFGRERHAPDAGEGRRLLAHELAHVVQHDRAASVAGGISAPGDAAERAADQAADAVLAGRREAEAAGSAAPSYLQRSPSSPSPSPGGGGGSIPTPTPKPDGTCDCRLDLCWRPIDLWYVPSYYKHGFINIIDSKCATHNLYVDPSKHKAGSASHSHAEDSTPGWDTSGETCATLNASGSGITCAHIDKLPASVARYEAMDVAYEATDGPNSNSFLEWILTDVGITVTGVHGGLIAWDYYIKNPSMRSSPPRVTRAAPAPAPIPAPAP